MMTVHYSTRPMRTATGCLIIHMPDKNLGIRIEDTVLVTGDGYEVLTLDVPKEISEIEELMASKSIAIAFGD